MTGERRRVETDARRMTFDDAGGAIGGERQRRHVAVPIDRAEHRAGVDLGGGKPGLQRLDGAQPIAAWDRDLLPCPSWSPLLLRISTRSPSGARSVTSSAHSSARPERV